MTSDRKQDRELEDKYEATVLDFLDKEMAAAQPARDTDKQSKELDALVSDLLKQVITEADQPREEGKLLFDGEDELFSGLTSDQKALGPLAEAQPAAAIPAADPVPAETVPGSALPAEEKTPAQEAPAFEAVPQAREVAAKPALLASGLAPARKLPVPAIAIACLVLIGAGAAYFFFGSSDKGSEAAKPQAVVASAPIPSQPETTAAAAPQSMAPATPAQAPPVQKREPEPRQARTEPTPAKTASAPTGTVSMQSQPVHNPEPVEPPPAPAAPPAAAAPAAQQPAGTPVLSLNGNAAPALVTGERKAEPLIARASTAAIPSLERTLIEAVPIFQASPVYPEIALRTRTSATVVLELQIDANGKVLKATPVSGPPMFHNSAVEAALKWRYRPASLGGVNVPSQSRVTMIFNLNK